MLVLGLVGIIVKGVEPSVLVAGNKVLGCEGVGWMCLGDGVWGRGLSVVVDSLISQS